MHENNVQEGYEMPDINRRIQSLVFERAGGNASKFAGMIGAGNSSKISRLFIPDKRNEKYPEPTLELITMISEALGVNLNWLIKGEEEPPGVKGINLVNSKVQGGAHAYGNQSKVKNQFSGDPEGGDITQQLLDSNFQKDAQILELTQEIVRLNRENADLNKRLLEQLSK